LLTESKKSICLLVLFFAVLLSGVPYVSARESAPPEVYVEQNAHPFEGCVYRKWNIFKTTALHKEPRLDSPIVTTVKPGEFVQAQTGIMYTHPARIVVNKYHEEKQYNGASVTTATFEEGEVIYLVASMGEGYFKVWHNGQIEIISIFGLKNAKGTYSPREYWGTVMDEFKSDWWVKLIGPDETVGWTNQTVNFGNKGLFSSLEVSVVLNNEYIVFGKGQYPYIENGCTMVELSTMAEKLKCTFSSNNDVVTVVSSKGRKAELVLGSKTALIDGRIIKLQAPTVSKGNNIYVPVSLLSEVSEANLEWDGETRQVKLSVIL
jgi:hypothetical protein